MARPLLIIDGDSFAHRSFHALPKTIRRRGDKGGGAIVGFANYLLRLYGEERPRAVLVGWDTLDQPTWRHQAFAPYQSGREFDPELLEQLDVLPEFVAACGFANAKAPGYEADDFLAAAVAKEEARGGTAVVASGDRDAFQLASARTTIVHPVRAGAMARIGPAEVPSTMASSPPGARLHRAPRRPVRPAAGSEGRRRQDCREPLRKYRTLENALADGRFAVSGGRTQALSANRDDGRCRSPALASLRETDVGQSGRAGARVGAQPPC